MQHVLILDDMRDEPLTEEERARITAWFDAALTVSMRQTILHGEFEVFLPTADMLSARPPL